MYPSGAPATTVPRPQFIDVRDYGAVWDNSTDDSAALASAIAALPHPQSGLSGNDIPASILQLPPGRGKLALASSLALPPNVTVKGQGPSGTYLNVTTAIDAFALAATGNVQIGIRDLGIICNGGGGGINFANQNSAASILGDTRHVIENVVVVSPGAGSYGVAFAGDECRINNVTVQRPAGTGIYVGGSDHMLQEVTVGAATGTPANGVFQLQGSNNRLVDVKIYGYTGGNSPMVINGLRNTILGLEFQDCNGFVSINQNDNAIYGLLVDSCGANGFINVGGSNNQVFFKVIPQRGGGAYTLAIAFSIGAASNHVLEGIVDGTLSNRIFASAANVQGNRVRLNGQGGTKSVAYTATVTPDPIATTVHEVGTVTGNLTVANPSTSNWSSNGTDFWAGQELVFILPVDATGGYTLAFGTSYKLVGGAAPALGASTTVQIGFRYDGTNWREVSRSIT